MSKKPKLCGCGEPGEHPGILYTMPKGGKFNLRAKHMGMKKIVELMCPTHYLENTFGLWPFVCLRKPCRTKREKVTGIRLDEGDMVLWIRLEVAIQKPLPLCPWCSKSMKPADKALVSTSYSR